MITKQTIKIQGMHCASCASIIERNLSKIDGVESISVNYGNESASLVFDETKTNMRALSESTQSLGYAFIEEKKEVEDISHEKGSLEIQKNVELESMKKQIMSVLPLAIFSIVVMTIDTLVQFSIIPEIPEIWKGFLHHLFPIFATYTFTVLGKPYILGMYRFFRYGRANMDTLIGLGTSVAFLYSFTIGAFEKELAAYVNVEAHYYDVTIVVLAFIALGKYLESRSKIQTGEAIRKLLGLQAKVARVIRDGEEREISIQEVVVWDTIRVLPGGRIPVDGTIVEGHSFIDESMITGEPIPNEKQSGDTVIGGTMNTDGSFIFTAKKVGSDTVLASIIKMVEDAQGSKAPIQALADKISQVFVPIVLGIAILSLILWLTVGVQYLGFSRSLSFGLSSFVGVLIIACPCALGLATPTAIIVGVGKGAQEGILIKDARTLELLHSVNTIIFDKTGTITKGKPELTSIHSDELNEWEVFKILSSLEENSEHPIAKAIMAQAKERNIEREVVTNFEIIQGKGLRGTINNTIYFAGNKSLMIELGLQIDLHLVEQKTLEGKTPIFLATAEKLLSTVFVADALKEDSKDLILNLHSLGIKTVMLSGDSVNTANFIGSQIGVGEVIGEVSPEGKLEKIRQLQKEGHIVAMIGDGINDAPALAGADVGIAMGTGTDVAIASAGITLLGGDISKVIKAIRLSHGTIHTIRQNLFFAFIYNIVGIPLAAGLFYPIFGLLLSPVFAGFAMALSSVSVVMNSLRLKGKKL